MSRQQPFNSTQRLGAPLPSPPRPAAGAPAGAPLPQYEGTSQTNTEDLLEDDDDEMVKTRVTDMPVLDDIPPKATMLGLGPPKPPSPPKPSSANVMHDYGAEDEDIVTTVMSSPLEEQEANTASISISTVHEPAKSQRPAAVPDDAIVVAPTLLGAHEQHQVQHPPMTMPTAQHQQYQQTIAPGYASAAPSAAEQQRSSVLIAVIAAATTLIALTLTALVVLKITESPKDEQPRANGTQLPPPPSLPPTVAGTVPGAAPSITVVPVPTAAPVPTMEGAVNPESLPKEAAKAPTPAPGPAPVAAAGPKPTPASGGAPAPVEKPATPGKGEPGFLTVMCVPACDSVTAGGRSLGPSPVVRAALPPGNHGVGLRAGSKKKSLSVTITSGQTTARRVTMD